MTMATNVLTSSARQRPRRRRAAGFTLIELMIAVLVVAVLMAIAYPSYQNHVIKTRRAAAAACTMESAQFMERFYTTNMRYDQSTAGAAVALPQTQCRTELAPFYTISLSAVAATTFTVQAAPQGVQATKDTKCATLSTDQAGTKRVSNTSTNATECW